MFEPEDENETFCYFGKPLVPYGEGRAFTSIGQSTLATSQIKSPSLASSQIKSPSFEVQDDKDFVDKVENSKEPVIVDFFSPWCPPCKTMEPRLENVIAQRKGDISVAKVDVGIDNLGEVAVKYDVESIPTLVVVENGKATERLVGLQDEENLTVWIDNALKK